MQLKKRICMNCYNVFKIKGILIIKTVIYLIYLRDLFGQLNKI